MHKFINNINQINFKVTPFLIQSSEISYITLNLFFKFFKTTLLIFKYVDKDVEGIPYEVTDKDVSGFTTIDLENGEFINVEDKSLLEIQNQDGYIFFRRGSF